MKLNTTLKDFKKNHLKRNNQIIFFSEECLSYKKIENLFKYILSKKNSFIFESVEKGKVKGRYTIIGYNTDKVWDIRKNNLKVTFNNKIKKIKVDPLKFINNLTKDFKVKIPKAIPPMASMLVGYFSYDIIRYIENIPDNCKDDLDIPDIRILRPKNLVIYDNLKKKIFYIQNIFFFKLS